MKKVKQTTKVAKPRTAKGAAKSVARGAAKRAATPSRQTSTSAVKTMDQLMAHAYALEIEASLRYDEFADAMEAHNNREVAELFRKLARIEHRHAEQILERMAWVAPPSAPTAGWQWLGLEGPETADPAELHYKMSAHHALSIARTNEARAEVFFRLMMRRMPAGAARKAAAELVQEEAEHVRIIDEWLTRTPRPPVDWAHDADPPNPPD